MPRKPNDVPLFNQRLKEAYLSAASYDDGTKIQINNIFKSCSVVERDKGRDVFEFGPGDISDLLQYVNRPSKGSLTATVSYLGKYVDWCISNGCRAGLNHFTNTIFSLDMLGKYVSRRAKSGRLVSFRDYSGYVERFNEKEDYQKSAMLILLYNCVLCTRQYNELGELKAESFDGGAVHLENRSVTLSGFESEAIKNAIEQAAPVGIEKCPKYRDGQFIIKKLRGAGPMTYPYLTSMLRKIGEEIGNYYMSNMTLYYSGIYHKLEQMVRNDGKDLSDVLENRRAWSGTRESELRRYLRIIMGEIKYPYAFNTLWFNILEFAP